MNARLMKYAASTRPTVRKKLPRNLLGLRLPRNPIDQRGTREPVTDTRTDGTATHDDAATDKRALNDGCRCCVCHFTSCSLAQCSIGGADQWCSFSSDIDWLK